MKWTLDQALTNWRNAFDSGHYSSARLWWAIVEQARRAEEADAAPIRYGNLPPQIAAVTYPIFGRFVTAVEEMGLPQEALDIGATMADELVAALVY